MLQLLVKLFAVAGDAGFEILKDAGVKGVASIKAFLKSLGPAGEFVLAQFEEHPNIAIVAFIAGSMASFFLGPVIAAAIGEGAIATVAGPIAGIIFRTVVSAAVDFGTSFFLTLVGGVIADAPSFPRSFPFRFLGKSFNVLARDPLVATGETVIGTIQDPKNGAIYTTFDNIPESRQGISGQVDISLLGSQFIQLEKGSFSQLVNTGALSLSTPLFTAFLQNKEGSKTGSLKLNPSTDDVKVIGADGTVIKLGKLPLVNSEVTLKVTLAKSGGTLVSALDNGDGGSAGQVLVDKDKTGNTVIASNFADQSIILGTGIDTLLHVGSGTVIDAGGNFDPKAGHGTAQFELSVIKNTLVVGPSPGDSISLDGNGFVQTGGTLNGTPGSTSLIVANGIGQTVSGGTGKNIIIAAGTNDTLNASQSGQKLIALGQSNDVLNGQTSDKSGLDRLIAVAGKVVNGTASNVGNDTLNAGVGNNILIGKGVNTTFNIDGAKNPNAIDVIWGQDGSDAINIAGNAQIFVVNAKDATLDSVKNLDARKITSYSERMLGRTSPNLMADSRFNLPMAAKRPMASCFLA